MVQQKRRLIRPDFEGEKRTIWFDPGYLQKDARVELGCLLPRKMFEQKKSEFLETVARVIQECVFLKREDSEGLRAKNLVKVAEKSRELLQALAAVNPKYWGEVRAFSQEFSFPAIASNPISDPTKTAIFNHQFWPYVWDAVQDVETIFFHAACQLKPAKDKRPKLDNAKVFVGEVATAYRRVTGKWPPKSKETWFLKVVQQAAELAQLGYIGQDIVESAISDAKHRFDASNKPIKPGSN